MSREIISSPHNARIRRLGRLRVNNTREQYFLLEGRAIIKEALQRGWPIEAIYYAPGSALPSGEITAFEVSEKVLQSVSALDRAPGILAVAKKRLVSAEQISLGNCSLLLDGIQDPGNVGALLRSAAAFGVDTVLSTTGTAHFYNPKVVRAAMSALFHLQLCENVDVPTLCALLRAERAQLIVADSRRGDDLMSLRASRKFVLALGNEAAGVSQQLKTMAEKQVKIPISSTVESLNVAIAGSILLYEWGKRSKVEGRKSQAAGRSSEVAGLRVR